MNKNIEKAARTLVEKILDHPEVFVKKAQQAVSNSLKIMVCACCVLSCNYFYLERFSAR